jgi:hypothetical protein
MGSAYGGVLAGIFFIVISVMEGIAVGVFIGLSLLVLSSLAVVYGRKRDL